MRIINRLFILMVVLIQNMGSVADTVILRDHVGQFIGSIIHQTSEVVIIDVKSVPIPVRRSDIAEIILTGGAPQQYVNQSGTSLMQPSIGFESGSNVTINPSAQSIDQTLLTSELPFYAPNETPISNNTIPIESQPFTGLPETPVSTINNVPNDMTQVFNGLPVMSSSNLEQPQTQPGANETPSNQPMLPVVIPTGKAYQVSGVSVRFRQGPSLDYPIVSTLPGKSVLLEMEVFDGWLHAKTLDGTEGWIHLNFVQPMLNQIEMVTGDNVHVREGASEINRSLARLRRGDVVIKLDESPGWHFILLNGSVAGWSSAEFLQPLENPTQFSSPMRMVQNDAAGLPVIIERIPQSSGLKINFTIRDDNIVSKGKTKICVLRHSDPNSNPAELNYVSESIFSRQKLDSSSAILSAGFPEALAVDYTSMDILTMLGARTTEGWQYTLTISPEEKCSFAFVVQAGQNRGIVVLIP